MSKAIGRDYKIGIGREGVGVRGAPADPQFWVPHRAFDYDDQVLTITDEQSHGVIEDSVDVKVVKKWSAGSLEGRVRDKSIGLLLLNVFGAVSTSPNNPESGVHTHTFTVLQSHQHPSFTLSIDDPIAGDKAYPLCMVSRFEIRAELEEAVIFSADMVGRKSEALTLTPGYAAENDFTAVDMEVGFAATAAELINASFAKVKSVSVVIETGAEKDDVLGQFDPDDVLNKTFRATIEITKSYENTTYKDYYKAGTGRAMRLKIQDDSATIGVNAHPKLQIDLNQVKLTGWSKSTDLDGVVIETLTFKANFKIADSKMIQAILVNTQSAYTAEMAGSQLGARAEIATP